MEINEYLLRVSGKVTTPPKELELGKDVELVLTGTVVKIEHKDTQEGTMDVVYVIKPLTSVIK